MGITVKQKRQAGAVQVAAAADDRDRVRLVAGPGTGKSYTIEERVVRLLNENADPKSVAAVSFTRASSQDLEKRVQAACERSNHGEAHIAVTTLHSLALRTLRAAGALAAYPVDPLVLDEWELTKLFDPEFARRANIGTVRRRREIREDHEAFWSTGQHTQRPAQRPPDPPISDAERVAFRAFHGPRTQLYACVLPGEIVQKCVQMLDAGTLDPIELLGIEHLIVDEFQDLNPMDLRFVYGLAELGATLFVAGDDDQSLYSFRYADPSGIQEFPDQFEVAGSHVLQHCFRCTPAVLASADALITQNAAPKRIPKDLVSLYADSEPRVNGTIQCWRYGSAAEEATFVALSCRRLIDAGMDPREIMVLVSNARALQWQLSAAFDKLDVPFEPPRETAFRDTDVGRAVMTVARIVSDRDDYVALRTLLELRSGVGIVTATAIADATIEHDLNYHDIFYEALPEDVFSPRAETALDQAREVCEVLLEWSSDDAVEDRAEALDHVIAMILGADATSSWRDEVEIVPAGTTIAELARFLSSEKDDERASILSAIHARLGNDLSPEESLPNRVRVMTMHGAKGLSATVVLIPGLEEQILPGETRARYPGQVLEAARMLYVSITRARLACLLSYANRRFINGQSTPHQASRFASHLGVRFSPGPEGVSTEWAGDAVRVSKDL
ncbi:ATP-dependent helicase [Solirubrobacter phytolaccae]|uniref:DNA 3'-5' helicase n=1 Tax=Solirubrobacter phytolaccae TaxID=1404360 RepID=A0A9X3NBZ3_9ACTN|nr:ATP-dependent helicase [Solirubrobacter phytolaccae]MDA0183643.1 ATP-dependent helicase [Solirubrobacter phytolaccae]